MSPKQKILIAIFTVVVIVACVALVVFIRSRNQSGQKTVNGQKSAIQSPKAEVLDSLTAPASSDNTATANTTADQKVIDSLSAPPSKPTTTKSKTNTTATAPTVDRSVLDSLSAPTK